MKVASAFLTIFSLGCFLIASPGCQTDTPGVKDTLGSYSAMVDGAPEKVTKAARSSVEDMKLLEVNSAGTAIDGKVTAKTAQGENVTVDVVQAGENISKVTVRVGAMGDSAFSQQIIDRIKKKMQPIRGGIKRLLLV